MKYLFLLLMTLIAGCGRHFNDKYIECIYRDNPPDCFKEFEHTEITNYDSIIAYANNVYKIKNEDGSLFTIENFIPTKQSDEYLVKIHSFLGCTKNERICFFDISCYEWGKSLIFDRKFGITYEFDEVPIFSPNQELFAVAEGKYFGTGQDANILEIYRIKSEKIINEFSIPTGNFDINKCNWKSNSELHCGITVYDFNGESFSSRQSNCTIVRKEKEWIFQSQ